MDLGFIGSRGAKGADGCCVRLILGQPREEQSGLSRGLPIRRLFAFCAERLVDEGFRNKPKIGSILHPEWVPQRTIVLGYMKALRISYLGAITVGGGEWG